MFLAQTRIGAGGSWSKKDTADLAVNSCAQYAQADWGGMFDLDDAEIEIVVWDVGERNWRFNRHGVLTDKDTGEEIDVSEVRTVRLPKRRKR